MRSWVFSLAMMSLAGGAAAADVPPPNAALRYWMAFAQMENPAAEGELAQRLERVAGGQEPWDQSLAPIVGRNEAALATMHRGARLERCDWGYETELLTDAPIANLPRARTLARLNVLHGLRLWQQERRPEALEAWLAGVHFARHIAAGGPLVSALVAASSLRAHLGALTRAVGERKLEPATLARLERQIAALPEDGIDWGAAARQESENMSGILAALEHAGDPVALLRSYFPDEHPAGPEAVRAAARRVRALNDELRPRLVAALQRPYEDAREPLRELDARAGQDPLLGRTWPSTARLNESRGELAQARAALLAALHAR
ncbi:MAG TPA: hypothetical protein VF310_13345 [Vicinamibacteria bacterium]